MKTRLTDGFINRTPLRFIGGFFILIVGILAWSLSLFTLGVFDLAISFAFFIKPTIEDEKILKVLVGLLYGAILLWCALWLLSKIS